MGQDLVKAAAAVVKMRAMAQNIIDLGDAVERMGSMENAESEAKVRMLTAQKDAESAKAEVAAAVKARDAAKTTAVEALKRTQDEAAAVMAKAQEAAQKTLSDAQTAAALIKQRAQSEADSAKSGLAAVLADHSGRVKTAQANVDELDAMMVTKKAELVALQAKINAAQETMQRMLAH